MNHNLFSDVETSYDGDMPIDPNSLDDRVAAINTEIIAELQRLSTVRDLNFAFTANLFNDVQLNLKLVYDRSGQDYDVFVGQVEGHEDSRVVFTVDGKVITLNVTVSEREFQVNPLEETIYLVEEVNLSAPFDCEQKTSVLGDTDREEEEQEDGDGSTVAEVKVLILYTPSVRVALNGNIGLKGYLRQMVENLNQSFRDSGVSNTTIVWSSKEADLAGLPSGYCATTDFLESSEEVKSWRRSESADLVSILRTDDGRSCADCLGTLNGRMSSAFSAVNLFQAKQRHTFSHEIGHNFGCNHDFEETGCAESSARGCRFPDDTKKYGTLMAYGGNRIAVFSNPEKSYKSHATGKPSRNNAACIMKTAPKVARYHEKLLALSEVAREI